MIRIWKENIWWGNTTFKKPTYATHGLILPIEKAKEITNANIIWQSYNRGTIQLDTPDNELWTYLENVEEQKYYFLYPNKTLSKSKNKLVYEVIPDVWINEIVRKQITGILKLSSNEDNIIKNNNLSKPIKVPLEIEEKDSPNINLYFNQVKYITEFQYGKASNVLSGSGDSFLHWVLESHGLYSTEIKAVAYPLNRWLDGTQLPTKFNNYYVLGGKISGVTSNKGFEVKGKQGNGNIFLEDQVFWKKYNLSGKPVNNTIHWTSGEFKPFDAEWMKDTIMTANYNNQTEIHASVGYQPLGVYKEKYVEPLMIKWLIGDRKEDYTESFSNITKWSFFISRVWKIDKPFNSDFKYKDDEWVIPLVGRNTQGIDTEWYNLRANIWNLYNYEYTPIYEKNNSETKVLLRYDRTKEPFKVKDDEYFISADEKIIFFRGHWILHKSLINVDSVNRLPLEVNNDVNYVIQFRDGETIELPYGTNIFDWQLEHKENGSILKYEIVNSHYWKGYNYNGNDKVHQDVNKIAKNVKIFKDDANLVDRQLKYTQLQLAQQENKFNQLKFNIEEKSRVGNFVGGIVGNVASGITSGVMVGASVLTGNVAGAVAGSAGIANSIQNTISQSVNFHYDTILRQEQFNLAQNQYAFKKQTMERELEKLNPKNNITNDWTEYMKWMEYGDDGFIIWELRPSAESRSLYNVYKESVGLETNDPYPRIYSLDNAGVYQFSEFTEWSPYNSEEIKHILTNPILVS